MVKMSQEARKITTELNTSYHEPEEICNLFSKLTGKTIDSSFMMFPPFYTDFGRILQLENLFLLIVAVIFKIKVGL